MVEPNPHRGMYISTGVEFFSGYTAHLHPRPLFIYSSTEPLHILTPSAPVT